MLEKAKQSLEKAKNELVEAEMQSVFLKKTFSEEEKKKSQQKAIVLLVAGIDAQLCDYDEFELLKQAFADKKNSADADKKLMESLSFERLQMSEKITELEKESKSLENAGADKAKIEAKLNELNDRRARLINLREEMKKLSLLELELFVVVGFLLIDYNGYLRFLPYLLYLGNLKSFERPLAYPYYGIHRKYENFL